MPIAKKILTEHKGRRCRYPGCKRVLSIYNHDTLCHAHLVKQLQQSCAIPPDNRDEKGA